MALPDAEILNRLKEKLNVAFSGEITVNVIASCFNILGSILMEEGVSKENCELFIKGGVRAFNKELDTLDEKHDN
jgi:hypothetical protein